MKLAERIRVWLKAPLDYKLHSVQRRVRKAYTLSEDFLFEKAHGLECRGRIPLGKLFQDDTSPMLDRYGYEAVSCLNLRTLINEAVRRRRRFDNFIDIGAGKGKACFYAAKQYDFKKIVGVELSDQLLQIAEFNREKFHASHIAFVQANAAEFVLPPGDNFVFLYNPFDDTVMEKFITANIDHFKKYNSIIAYANDRHRACLTEAGFMPLYRDPIIEDGLYQYRNELRAADLPGSVENVGPNAYSMH